MKTPKLERWYDFTDHFNLTDEKIHNQQVELCIGWFKDNKEGISEAIDKSLLDMNIGSIESALSCKWVSSRIDCMQEFVDSGLASREEMDKRGIIHWWHRHNVSEGVLKSMSTNSKDLQESLDRIEYVEKNQTPKDRTVDKLIKLSSVAMGGLSCKILDQKKWLKHEDRRKPDSYKCISPGSKKYVSNIAKWKSSFDECNKDAPATEDRELVLLKTIKSVSSFLRKWRCADDEVKAKEYIDGATELYKSIINQVVYFTKKYGWMYGDQVTDRTRLGFLKEFYKITSLEGDVMYRAKVETKEEKYQKEKKMLSSLNKVGLRHLLKHALKEENYERASKIRIILEGRKGE